ncbi:hypothetical protein A2467_00545 [Candidatus Nomurabacteria bacterium RIFOXYC2_FULL_36_8]|nr:MAG: hypothetical protein UR97_C0010G0007 [Candidatus Nomurabacteria bacterium GW2011_GWE2_36_115]KKP93215.1 MAG: hypothetical protein US00_C0010G0007 [Candidatus Nomurabacteria bacterium GW2011_GWF2_36_126]KKP97059.1 MAG: hypothetical protein US04_C0001G0562 [Candidatus Nomurabacteria bacterium GW2011_GWD2_36_14]KKP99337.1 MAG: hypothetical protein US08_C0001G0019 [Candidatus Nomurabacteria bacterium GW2011_GWF2_36_19]KKQ04899.1 MAG: hypothetical protein US17_C0011G0007 [Candidatus Nomuraba
MKNLAEIDVYKTADLIVETTFFCNLDCGNCPFHGVQRKLNLDIYLNNLYELVAGEIVVLRGGEITTINNWFESFVVPAINKELLIIIETNGYFIGRDNYYELLTKLSHVNVFIRIGFDISHGPTAEDFSKMAFFAKDAIESGVRFGFYSVNMSKNQIKNFLYKTKLEPFLNYFHSLREYIDFSRVKLKGKYLKSDGQLISCIY